MIYEDSDLLVVSKPAGWNTHAPSPYAGEGIFDWLRHREPAWGSLAIIHRLDKETSGVLIFSKSPLANRSLTQQFTDRAVRKRYLLLTDRKPPKLEFTARSVIKRAGDKYVSARVREGRSEAVTRFKVLGASARPGCIMIQAEPLTGRTHQIRAQAAEHGFPVLGDTLYGGSPAERVFLHACEITFLHPATGAPSTFQVKEDFAADPRFGLRVSVIDRQETAAFRLIHGASDRCPGLFMEQLGEALLCHSLADLTGAQRTEVQKIAAAAGRTTVYHKRLVRHVRVSTPVETSPRLIEGNAVPDHFSVLENGLKFELSFDQGYSVGLFLDQRENRRRLLKGHIAAGFPLFALQTAEPRRPQVLNTFAYTCAFSVCAARTGAVVTSIDVSKKYLEWGKRNFALNGLEPAEHDFIFGDVFEWLKRLRKKGRQFDLLLLDPPTFSNSRAHGIFRAEHDYGDLVSAALPLLSSPGVLFASTNAASWPPEEFLAVIRKAVSKAARTIKNEHYVPQPPDFPVSRAEPPYLKTAWFRLE